MGFFLSCQTFFAAIEAQLGLKDNPGIYCHLVDFSRKLFLTTHRITFWIKKSFMMELHGSRLEKKKSYKHRRRVIAKRNSDTNREYVLLVF